MERNGGKRLGRSLAVVLAASLGLGLGFVLLLQALLSAERRAGLDREQDRVATRLARLLAEDPESAAARGWPALGWVLLDRQGRSLQRSPPGFQPGAEVRDRLLLGRQLQQAGWQYRIYDLPAAGEGRLLLLGLRQDPAAPGVAGWLLGLVLLLSLVPAALASWQLVSGQRAAQELQREGEDSGRSREAFLSCISHEFRTPLTNIYVFADLLDQGEVPEAAVLAEFAQIIRVEVLRLRRLVDDAMEYTQAVGAGDALRGGTVDLCVVLDSVLEELRPRARDLGLQLEVDTAGGPYLVASAQAELAGVLSRVLDNAMKFSPSAGRVRVQIGPHEGGCLLSVEDEGPGVVQEERRRVLLPLVQLGDLMTSKPAGTGLGLSYCNQGMRTLGGRIWLEDSELGGLRVCLSWPPPDPAELSAAGVIRIGRPTL